jgi:hypothetical protein
LIEWDKLTIIVVITNDNLLDQTVATHLHPDVFIEGVEMALHLLRIHAVLRVVLRVLVEVGEEDGLRIRRLDMLARAAVTVATSSDLVIEGAVDLELPC